MQYSETEKRARDDRIVHTANEQTNHSLTVSNDDFECRNSEISYELYHISRNKCVAGRKGLARCRTVVVDTPTHTSSGSRQNPQHSNIIQGRICSASNTKIQTSTQVQSYLTKNTRNRAAMKKSRILFLRMTLIACFMVYSTSSNIVATIAASTSASAYDEVNESEADMSSSMEYRVGTFYDDMEDGECIDLDSVLDENKKKEDIMKMMKSLNIDLGAQDGQSSRLKRRPESLDVTDSLDSQQSAQPEKNKITEEGKEDSKADSDSVLIISAVDGTLAGISRSSGQIIWKQSRNNHDAARDNNPTISSAVSVDSLNKFLSPLVSTTTKSTSNSPGHHHSQWHAVPSIDGTVYLTAAAESDLGGSAPQELSITTHIRDLVDRAPFVDAHGRFFVGSRRAMVAAIDERTGEILRVIPRWKSGKKSNEEKSEDSEDDENNSDNPEEEEQEELPPSLEGRSVVWIGRLEHTVTVHDLQKGSVDTEFSIAEILSVDEMIRGNQLASPIVVSGDGDGDIGNEESSNVDEEGMERLFTKYIAEALRHPSYGDRLLSLPAPTDFDEDDLEDDFEETKRKIDASGSPFLVSTPGGNVAFRDSVASTFGWVSFHLLASPVVYAIEASSGQKIKVNIMPDSPSPSESNEPSQDSSCDDLSETLQRQIAYLSRQGLPMPSEFDECSGENMGECRALAISEPTGAVVGVLADGQLYAMPLGTQTPRQQMPLALPIPHSKASSLSHAQDIHKAGMNTKHAIDLFHGLSSGVDMDSGDNQRLHIDSNRQACTPSSPLYPGCLIGASLMMGNIILDRDEMASVFEASDLDFDLYLDMLEGSSNRKRNSYSQKLIKILSSWIAPIVALIFVVSFEMGRRERLKAETKGADSSEKGSDESGGVKSSTNSPGAIQLTDEILGYGGHGTIVYRGVLDKRQVAVKRLLSMYHTSADREISLLIESDGHPNVVRYFLKEVRGDFVYLALELCAISLNDLIQSLSKLKNSRKENFTLFDADGFEFVTRSLLYQIASGVRHIHSLRIVHRDLKPQNILLAQRTRTKPATEDQSDETESELDFDETQTQTTCSDTNAILEMFMNDEYIPKISDMGLGKQLAGQSSFGLSTLGTGSIGHGPGNNNPSIAGAGAGSVGWQAPEVMAMRFSNETSSYDGNESFSEASPYECAVSARTSRSVDIFSLGCIFYCTVLPGSHPFGEWYEREANIMKNKPNKEDLEFVSPEASDLILSMIHRNPKSRPTADEVCEHPFFWSLAKRLKFLCELSDRLELCDIKSDRTGDEPPELNIFAVEKGAFEVFGTSWEKKVDSELLAASLNRRTYDPASVRDCLRMIRNKHHHYDELPTHIKSRIGSNTDGFSRYIGRRFPRLVIHCYHFCIANMSASDSLVLDYKLPVSSAKSIVNQTTSIIELTEPLTSLEPISDVFEKDTVPEQDEEEKNITSPSLEDEPETQAVSDVYDEVELAPSNESVTGIVLWSGSNAAKQFNCRGWERSEDEWIQRLDAKMRKRDANVTRCADDPKFRTRLCNEWDLSGGTFCSMRKKNKCIFAHGPVELRVKEGKRKRWGKLVNKQGECTNPKASGGEDTYSAAKTIEDMRKERGEWNTKTPKKQHKTSNGKNTKDQKKRPFQHYDVGGQ